MYTFVKVILEQASQYLRGKVSSSGSSWHLSSQSLCYLFSHTPHCLCSIRNYLGFVRSRLVRADRAFISSSIYF